MSTFLAGLRRKDFLGFFFFFYTSVGKARVSHQRESLILRYKVKNRNDLILTKHFPLGKPGSQLYSASQLSCKGSMASRLTNGGHLVTCLGWVPGFPREMGSLTLLAWKG